MKDILNKLIAHETLQKEEAKAVLVNIAEGNYNNSQITAFLTVYMMRTVTVQELEGFRDALLELCIETDLSAYDPIDLCGTGGDGKNTFNISTLASFVTAGAGIKVAKHGNYGVSSTCGSSNVLEHLGVKFTADKTVLERQIDKAGICFLHAPLFHPALKNVGPIRKELGMKTFFNMLGPMVNPARPKKQLVGVFNLELARIYAYLYQQTGNKFVILHALDGFDEVSLTGSFKMISNQSERISEAKDFGVEQVELKAIAGGADVKESAEIFTQIIKGEGTKAQNNVVCANAGMAIHCTYPELNLEDAFQLAQESLLSGRALQSFQTLIN
jgi:anthranilate phosphoribosyltransferase